MNKLNMQLSLVKNFQSIQDKIEDITRDVKLDVKQISDLERYVGMQSTIVGTLDMLSDSRKGKAEQ